MLDDSPRGTAAIIGQRRLKELLSTKIARAFAERRPLPHMLFNSPPSTGKSTLAARIAEELGVNFRSVSSNGLATPGDLVALLTNMRRGDVLLVRAIDAIPESVAQWLVDAVGKFTIEIRLSEGSKAQVVTMPIEPFTLIGTTSSPARVHRRLLPWLAVQDFERYSRDEVTEIVRSMALQRRMRLSSDGAAAIVNCSNESLETAAIIVARIVDYLGAEPTDEVPADSIRGILDWYDYEQRAVTSISLAERLSAMTGTQFEEFIAAEFRKRGYRVELTGVTGDHGIDLVLHKSGARAVVQCKRWDGTVGEPVVRDFYGSMISHGAELGFVVTTSTFTAQATTFASNKPLRLIDLDTLLAIAQGVREIEL